MKNAVPTDEQDALFEFFFDYEFELGWDVPDLYHYRSGSSVSKMFNKDNLILRLTAADQFEDKLEGKAVEVYYDITLEKLARDGKITAEQFKDLSTIDIPDKTLIIHKTDEGMNWAKWEEFETYVICFSTEKDDPFMYERYVHNKSTGGFCIELSGIEIRSLSQLSIDNESHIKLIPVMYGEKTVRYLESQIMRVAGNSFLYKNRNEVIGEILHQIQFSAKRSRYSKENEIRLLIYLAKGDYSDHPNLNRDRDEKEKIISKYINFKIPKEVVFNVTADTQNEEQTTKRMMASFQELGYHFI